MNSKLLWQKRSDIVAQNELVLNYTKDQLDEAIKRFNSDEYMKKPVKRLKITENNIKDKIILDYAMLDVEVPIYTFPNIIIPSDRQQDFNPTSYDADGFGAFSVGKIPEEYIDTSGATAGKWDIFNGKTAFVNGELVTGSYASKDYNFQQSNVSNYPGCSWSTTEVRLKCGFEPTYLAIVLNSGNYTNNRVLAVWARTAKGGSPAIVYHTRTSNTSGNMTITRTQITENTEAYWYYNAESEEVVIKSPTTSYLWSTYTYRYFLFK